MSSSGEQDSAHMDAELRLSAIVLAAVFHLSPPILLGACAYFITGASICYALRAAGSMDCSNHL